MNPGFKNTYSEAVEKLQKLVEFSAVMGKNKEGLDHKHGKKKLSKDIKNPRHEHYFTHPVNAILLQIQSNLFSFFDEMELVMTVKLQELVKALEMIDAERFLRVFQFSSVGRPCKDWTAMARVFVTKALR